mgnify:CR=1 FL=1
MKIHEYQAKELLRKAGVAVPQNFVAATPEEAAAAFKQLGGAIAVVKAQIHAGGRGKGTIEDNPQQHGVQLVRNAEEAAKTAGNLLGHKLVTIQTGPEGQTVRRVLVEAGCDIARELYLGIVIDRASAMPVLMASSRSASASPSALLPEDRCHLNGLAVVEGEPRYVNFYETGRTDLAHTVEELEEARPGWIALRLRCKLQTADRILQFLRELPVPLPTEEREEIARTVDIVVECFRRGGRLIYVGAGTSGRLGVLDASEMPPTYGTDPVMVQGLIAGGYEALVRAQEGAEDHPEDGARDIAARGVGPDDFVLGIASSGTTPRG